MIRPRDAVGAAMSHGWRSFYFFGRHETSVCAMKANDGDHWCLWKAKLRVMASFDAFAQQRMIESALLQPPTWQA